jgi:hypothetical protein
MYAPINLRVEYVFLDSGTDSFTSGAQAGIYYNLYTCIMIYVYVHLCIHMQIYIYIYRILIISHTMIMFAHIYVIINMGSTTF